MLLAHDSYRTLDPELDWPLIDPRFRVSAEARQVVCPLTRLASSAVWNTYVSANPMERHPMLLPNEHWLRPTKPGPNWVPEFNNDSESFQAEQGNVSAFLRQCFALEEDEPILFVAMRESSYSMPLKVFLQHWPCFLANDDEGSFLFHPTSGTFAQFGPNGSLAFGSQSVSNAA